MWRYISNDELYHYGIKGQRKGVRNGPPYPLSGGDYSSLEIKKNKFLSNLNREKIDKNPYAKKHKDFILDSKKTTLTTLSYDRNRTRNTDMFFAATNRLDKAQYNSLFNKKIEKPLYDDGGNYLGTGKFYKFKINNRLKRNMKVASEDSGVDAFSKLYKKDRDFYNFVTDKNRMMDLYPKDKYVFKGYRESMAVIDKMANNKNYKPTKSDVAKMYRLFNYTLPNDGGGNEKVATDVKHQRTKFFNELKKEGYGAVLDTNDAIYGGFKARSPVIVFDMDQVIPKDIKNTYVTDKAFSDLIMVGRKVIPGI